MSNKIIFALFALCFSQITVALPNARSVYQALNVKAKNACTAPVCPNAETTLVKQVAGVTCYEVSSMAQQIQTKYSCSINSKLIPQELYSALTVVAKNACTAPVCPNSEVTMVKGVSGLECAEKTTMSAGMKSSYSCKLDFTGENSDDLAKSAINNYFIAKSLATNLSQLQLCTLAGQATIGFALLRDKTTKQISNLLEVVKENEVSFVRDGLLKDQIACK